MAHKCADLYPLIFCSIKVEKVNDGCAQEGDYMKLNILSAGIILEERGLD